jgi:hypothetical protein
MLRISKFHVPVLPATFCALTSSTMAHAQTNPTDQYIYCTFRPQAASCDAIYRLALRDPSPSAQSVKAAFEGYGRYVRNARGTLSEDDRGYLKTNGITLPPDLTAEDQAGLHAVINDSVLAKDADARRLAVNNFLSRAVQAELYCSFNSCNEQGSSTRGALEAAR